MDKRICTNCQTELLEDQLFCPNCGTKYEPPVEPVIEIPAEPAEAPAEPVIEIPAEPVKPVCPNCGAELQPDQNFCITCGHKLGTETNVPEAQPAMAAPAQFYAAPQAPVKKKKKTVPIIIGAVAAAVIILLILVVAVGGGPSEKDFEGRWNAVEFYEYSNNISLTGFTVYLDFDEDGTYTYCLDYDYYYGTWSYDEDNECIDCYNSSGGYQYSFYYDDATGQLEQEIDEFTMVFEKE